MSKQYGLILPGQKKAKVEAVPEREITKPSIFNESSSSDDDDRPQLKAFSSGLHGPSLMERRMARSMQEKALKEDPTVFQYDELYDEMESQRDQEHQAKSKEPKKPKYIERLMEVAERRKLENELRIERQVEREREQEGDEFKDKECFVTETYRKKLEEIRKLEEQEKRDDYLEAIGDVTKQNDLDGFYRHLYEQKIGTTKEVKKPDLTATTLSGDEESVEYKPIKSGKVPQQRTYRKRRATDEKDEGDEVAAESTICDKETKKIHLSNNIDADSDFSIDSSSDEDDGNDDQLKAKVKQTKGAQNESKMQISANTIALNLDALKKENIDQEDEKSENEQLGAGTENNSNEFLEEEDKPKPKRDKSEIWKKRTVGEVFEAAVQRYYERRAARNA